MAFSTFELPQTEQTTILAGGVCRASTLLIQHSHTAIGVARCGAHHRPASCFDAFFYRVLPLARLHDAITRQSAFELIHSDRTP